MREEGSQRYAMEAKLKGAVCAGHMHRGSACGAHAAEEVVGR